MGLKSFVGIDCLDLLRDCVLGGLYFSIRASTPYLSLIFGIPPHHTPSIKINEYVKGSYKRWYFKLRFMGNYIKMWTPNDVQKYALQLKSYKK